MAVELKGFDIPMKASPNVGGGGLAQYTAVILDSAAAFMDCIQATATSTPILGINQDEGDQLTVNSTTPPTVQAGDSMRVRVSGISKAIAGGAITVGQYVAVNGSGQLVAATMAAGATNSFIVGQALTAATGAGDVFSVLLLPGAATQVSA